MAGVGINGDTWNSWDETKGEWRLECVGRHKKLQSGGTKDMEEAFRFCSAKRGLKTFL